MAEYALLLAATTGAQLVGDLGSTLRANPMLWGGAGAVLLLVAAWLSKPNR